MLSIEEDQSGEHLNELGIPKSAGPNGMFL